MSRIAPALGPSLLFAAVATCLPQAVSAQSTSIFMLLPTEDRVLEAGGEYSGALSASDYVGDNGAYLEAWALEGRTGESARLELAAEAFYAELRVAGPGLAEPLTGARCLDVTFLENGTFHVVVTTWEPSATGTYALRVSEAPGDSSGFDCEEPSESTSLDSDILELPLEGRALSLGSTEGSRLGTGDLMLDGEYAEAWSLDAQAGDRLAISMESDDFDTYLYLANATGIIGQDDDGAGDLNSRIETTLTGSGPFVVAATAYSGTGAYTIRVDGPGVDEPARVEDPVRVDEVPTNGRTIANGDTVEGMLGAGDPSFRDRPAQAWALEGAAGDALAVELSSDDFDAYLYIVGPGLDERDDDGAGGLDSRLEVTLPESGSYRVIASSYGDGTGSYTLSVRDPGDRSLRDAVERGDSGAVDRLLEGGADPNAPFRFEGVDGVTALFMAVGEEHPDIVRTLLEHGADPNVNLSADDITGLTPLTLASVEGYTEIASALLDYGAQLDARLADDENDLTLLAAAASEGEVEIVRLLLEHGADPNATVVYEGDAGMTPLTVAVSEGYAEVVDILLEYGATDSR